jgi:predicted membrane protein (TIGR00267 family)
MAVSFIVGAIVPILPYLIVKGSSALYVSIILSAAALFAVGVFKGFLAGKSLIASGLQFFVIAVGAALAGYLIGLAVQHFFPGITLPAG